ncbi:MAG: hypothetical protein LBC63_09535 [Holophagales bacterium]|jgi:hypothetical protein|nr:hypothetical protein [Holophagales bacterium]
MLAKTLRILDACSTAILALWLGIALSYFLSGSFGLPILSALIILSVLSSLTNLLGRRRPFLSFALLALWLSFKLTDFFLGRPPSISEIDLCAWFGFGLPMLLSWLPRWINHISDTEAIGPLRLWAAAGAAALTMCLASQSIATPKITELRAQISQESIPAKQKEALSQKLKKAEKFSAQFLYIRAALAAALMLGLLKLPFDKNATCETSSPKS